MSGNRCTHLIIGCGYLGRRIAQMWLAQGATVAALTRSALHADEFRQLGIEPIVGDILAPDSLRRLPAASTVLYAVGFDRHRRVSKRTVYVDGLRNVVHALSSHVMRFLYVSSTSVYGQSAGEWVNETSRCEPRSDGGRICLDAERLLQSSLAARVPVHIMRLSGLYGPGRLIARSEGLRAGRPLTGNPDAWLNLIHVDDAARAVVACSDTDGSAGETLLISDDRPIPRRTYYEQLARLVGAPRPVFEGSDLASTDLGKRCDNRRLRQELDIPLAYPNIDAGLPHAVATDS